MTAASTLTPPAHSNELIVEFPADHVLLLTFNRPKALNAMTPTMTEDLRKVLDWFETEPQLWVAIVTGVGRVFCAGADLKAWNNDQQKQKTNEQDRIAADPHGFASISRRQSIKPIIAAVSGGAYGGGTEIVLNCDFVVAGAGSKFALPEVKRGVVAIQGALAVAREIIANSPDAVQSTKEGLLISQKLDFHSTVLSHSASSASTRVYKGLNIKVSRPHVSEL
ncbi:hypothetical protein H0H92_008115 [Tricholoma furcatifolium]|nr:hypothetical protein H0H92_008115 [Tricholoma furcatifolium]